MRMVPRIPLAERDASAEALCETVHKPYVENHSRADLLDQVLDGELPRYAEALERLGR